MSSSLKTGMTIDSFIARLRTAVASCQLPVAGCQPRQQRPGEYAGVGYCPPILRAKIPNVWRQRIQHSGATPCCAGGLCNSDGYQKACDLAPSLSAARSDTILANSWQKHSVLNWEACQAIHSGSKQSCCDSKRRIAPARARGVCGW